MHQETGGRLPLPKKLHFIRFFLNSLSFLKQDSRWTLIICMEQTNLPNESAKEQEKENPAIIWHPAFLEAIKLELEEYKDSLEFQSEVQLATKPLQIDCVIIKKVKNVEISKNIAAIFRDVNILEYKSPRDYISVKDYYKVYGYACFYSSLKNVPFTSLTISFIESRYPRELITHLKKIHKYIVEETCPGIYTVKGNILPIQIINSCELSTYENLWLRGLSNRLNPLDFLYVQNEIYCQNKAEYVRAYMHVITQANYQAIEEAIHMSNNDQKLAEIFERTGMAAIWQAKAEAKGITIGEAKGIAIGEAKGIAIGEAKGIAIGEAKGIVIGEARGEERKAIDIAKNMLNKGYSIEQTAELSGLNIEKVKTL